MARSDWRPSTKGFARIGETMGMPQYDRFCSRFEPAFAEGGFLQPEEPAEFFY
jgi:hypothetical protein